MIDPATVALAVAVAADAGALGTGIAVRVRRWLRRRTSARRLRVPYPTGPVVHVGPAFSHSDHARRFDGDHPDFTKRWQDWGRP